MSLLSQNSKLNTHEILSEPKWTKLDEVLKPLTLTDDVLQKIMSAFREQMHLANSTDENVRKTSDHLMMNTFIRILLDGTEQGDFLGLDLGGTNFRVVLVRFKDGVADTVTQYYNLTDETLSGPAAGVFDFIAESIQDFLEKQGLAHSEKKIPLGFTFSFPSTQLALNKSILLTWTKTFKCPDGVGEDPVAMLEAAIQRKNKDLPVDVVVVMSDTVSTLMAGNYLDKKCRVGLILGTGCNAAFVENISDIDKWTGDNEDPKHVIVNVELGSTGDNGCMDFCRSEYEKEVDKYSNHPGSFTFEKSFSGMYLGELIRLVLVRLIKEGVLFVGKAETGKLFDGRWKFTTSHVTDIESELGDSQEKTRNVLKNFDLDIAATDEDVAIVREVCQFMSRRGAHIIAAGMSVLINYIRLPEVTVGIDGSLFEKHPKFHDSMMEIFEKYSPDTKVKMILAKDGSGQGAAFAAVSALRQLARGIRCS
ncbi:Hexokinase-2 [Bulinus truncatus]|nr:Hexokinase-2 [Bulinus truncatus]